MREDIVYKKYGHPHNTQLGAIYEDLETKKIITNNVSDDIVADRLFYHTCGLVMGIFSIYAESGSAFTFLLDGFQSLTVSTNEISCVFDAAVEEDRPLVKIRFKTTCKRYDDFKVKSVVDITLLFKNRAQTNRYLKIPSHL